MRTRGIANSFRFVIPAKATRGQRLRGSSKCFGRFPAMCLGVFPQLDHCASNGIIAVVFAPYHIYVQRVSPLNVSITKKRRLSINDPPRGNSRLEASRLKNTLFWQGSGYVSWRIPLLRSFRIERDNRCRICPVSHLRSTSITIKNQYSKKSRLTLKIPDEATRAQRLRGSKTHCFGRFPAM